MQEHWNSQLLFWEAKKHHETSPLFQQFYLHYSVLLSLIFLHYQAGNCSACNSPSSTSLQGDWQTLVWAIIETHPLVSTSQFRCLVVQAFGSDLHLHHRNSPPEPGFRLHYFFLEDELSCRSISFKEKHFFFCILLGHPGASQQPVSPSVHLRCCWLTDDYTTASYIMLSISKPAGACATTTPPTTTTTLIRPSRTGDWWGGCVGGLTSFVVTVC